MTIGYWNRGRKKHLLNYHYLPSVVKSAHPSGLRTI